MKIAQDPDTGGALSLADTLAKATFGDPEGQMKARALASEVGLRMASRDKAIADTGLIQAKTKSEQDAEDAILAAGPAIGAAGAAAVPVPVASFGGYGPSSGEGYGPQPGIVSQHDLDVNSALKARERAIGPLLARGTPDQVAKGVNENYGGTILSAAAANPAIVSGDSLRIAGGLSTGSAPTTSTVWSAGDTSGVDAAARQKILEERGAAEKPVYFDLNNHRYRQNPDGSATEVTGVAAPDPKLVTLPGQGTGVLNTDAQGHAIGVTQLPGAEGRPEKPNEPKTFQGPDGKMYAEVVDPITGKLTAQLIGGVGPAPVKPVEVGPNALLPPDPNNPNDHTYHVVPTDRPPPGPTTPFAESKGDEGIAFNTVLTIANRAAHGETIGNDDARLYATTYNRLFGPKWDQKPDAQGVLRWVVAPGVPPPPGMVLPAPETFLGGQPPVAQPPVAQPPVAQPPVAQPRSLSPRSLSLRSLSLRSLSPRSLSLRSLSPPFPRLLAGKCSRLTRPNLPQQARRRTKRNSFFPRCKSPRRPSTSTTRETCRVLGNWATPCQAKSLGRSVSTSKPAR